jgi:hypothetical protein
VKTTPIGNGRNPPGGAISSPLRLSTALDPEPTAQADPEPTFIASPADGWAGWARTFASDFCSF